MAIEGLNQGQARAAADAMWLRRWILNAARSIIGPIPILGPGARHGLRRMRIVNQAIAMLRELTRTLAQRPGEASSLLKAWRLGGADMLREQACLLLGIPSA